MTDQTKIVPPGGIVGILGGGQLGRMLSLAAARLGMDVHIFAPEDDTPAGRVSSRTFRSDFDDVFALEAFADSCDVITYEFENVPVSAVQALLDAGANVRPGAVALEKTQDRYVEKQFLETVGVPPAQYAAIDRLEDIAPALEQLGGRGILKARRSGYDGKGQALLESNADANSAWRKVGMLPSVLEAFVAFEREISIILSRSCDGEIAVYDVSENNHDGGILRYSHVPASVSSDIERSAIEFTKRLAEGLDYVGVLALELFVMSDGSLRANEFAPRVHNSGHWTEDACKTGQFEQHIRAICGWPLGSVTRSFDAEMINLLGQSEVDRWSAYAAQGDKIHVYGKRGGGEGRKMGHVNRLKPMS